MSTKYYVPFQNASPEERYLDAAADAAEQFLATAEGPVATLVQRFDMVHVFVSFPNEFKGGVQFFGDTFRAIEEYAQK